MHILLRCPSSKGTFRSVGLLYIATAARNRGYPARMIDLSVYPQSIDYPIFDVVGIHSGPNRFNEALVLA